MNRDDRKALFAFTGLVLTGFVALAMYACEARAMSAEPVHYGARSEAQSLALRSTAPEFCYSGRVFGGKSWIGCAKAFLYASKYAGARVLVAREERASMEGTTLVTLRSEIVPPLAWSAYWKESKSALYLPNGSEIHVLGLDKPERILSARYGFVFVDQAEQLARHQFELVNSRITQVGMPWHQLFLAFNPEHPEHWAYKRYTPDSGNGPRYDESGRHYADVVLVAPADMMDLLSPESRARLDGMEGAWRERLRLGRWVAFEGSVYGDYWQPSVHVIETPVEWSAWGGYPPPDWTRYRSCDFGAQNPFVCQWWAEDSDGRFYRYREVYRTGGTHEEWAQWICEQEERELAALRDGASAQGLRERLDTYLCALNVRATITDHDLGARLALQRAGIGSVLANKDMPDGVRSVMSMLKVGPSGPRCFFLRDALVDRDPKLVARKVPTRTEEEFAGYRWQKDREKGNDLGPRDQVVKENDHGLDAMRYLFHTLQSTRAVV